MLPPRATNKPAFSCQTTKLLAAGIALALISGFAPQAQANSTLTVNYTAHSGPGTDPDFDAALASYTGTTPTTQYLTGLIGVSKYGMGVNSNFTGYIDNNLGTTHALQLYCGEVSQNLPSLVNQKFSIIEPQNLTAAQIRNIGLLYQYRYQDVSALKTSRDAFQLALWELTYDGAPLTPNTSFTSSFFRASDPVYDDAGFATPLDGNDGTVDVLALAQSYLNDVYGVLAAMSVNDPLYQLHAVDALGGDANVQDFYIPKSQLIADFPSVSVPEPATFGFGLGLSALCASARLRSRRSKASV